MPTINLQGATSSRLCEFNVKALRAKLVIEQWRRHYNKVRPSCLGIKHPWRSRRPVYQTTSRTPFSRNEWSEEIRLIKLESSKFFREMNHFRKGSYREFLERGAATERGADTIQ